MTTLTTVLDTLETLIGFDTTSRNSNLDVIDWIEAQLAPLGATCVRIPNSEGDKSNLWVRIGPDVEGGLILSGHTDVVPIDDQDWVTDPFRLTTKGDRLFGRGTSDMKSFIALCLAFAPAFARLELAQPVHFAFSYDEEVGCKGAPSMIAELLASGARPKAVWVGEPTRWDVVSGHKGILLTQVDVTGHEAHSSLPDFGISAISEAVDLMYLVKEIAEELRLKAPKDSPFDPAYPTLTLGVVRGGTATNILARSCTFMFDLRCPPGFDPDDILAPFETAAQRADERLKARFPGAGVRVTRLSNVPPLDIAPENAGEQLVRALTGDNALRAVSYATEAGQFSQAGVPAVVCGPGSIEQAHKPNEYIERAQLEQGVDIFTRLLKHLMS